MGKVVKVAQVNSVEPKQTSKYIVFAIGLAIAFLLWSNNIFAGSPPSNIGVNNGKLAACASTPNCVSSGTPISDSEHAIVALPLSGDLPTSMAKLKQTIQAMPRTKVVKETNNYLYVEFTSNLMRFVDDVEFYLDDRSQTIQVRSASRLGESDLGVNRQRIEEIRTKLAN
ncbi:DUF1499 domain-containing protein [Chamaesiphon sp. GL140_3_metabinner_50]|uniref:DUF1499 domain-containing protein n=1 Tax=Chamaesiphon sp. GL140_3_metabinner_50 TaxID=2970812 RepID=UPI0025FBD5D0|nr:DUF1499 domain-containing protein [Chamaesiphon sp. GL140_3_metabinner_50]